jgi:hypothetical protein
MTLAPRENPGAARDWRRGARGFYRVATVAAVILIALLAVVSAAAGDDREPFYTLQAVMLFGIALAALPGLAVLAAIGSIRLAGHWRYALPAWLYTLGTLLVCIDQFLYEGRANLWVPASVLAGASLIAAAWAAWLLKPGSEEKA